MSSKAIIDLLDIMVKCDTVWEPLCDVSFDAKYVFVEMDIPNLDSKTLSVTIINGKVLEVLGEMKKYKEKDTIYLLAERVFGKFRKRVELPFGLGSVEKIEYDDGVLEIMLSRSEL
jgi:HSP20 family protein